MEENNNDTQEIKEEIKEENKKVCFEGHCWKKCFALVCAAFLGGFLAFYFVADQMLYKFYRPQINPQKFEKRMFDDFEKMALDSRMPIDNNLKMNKKMLKMQNGDSPAFLPEAVKIKTDFTDNKFNIIVGLKAFQDNEDKVNYKVTDRKITVFGSSEVKDKDYEREISFSQDFILPENADTTTITKTKEGHKLIISIPLKG
jgi:hypothetical protein